MRRRWVWAIQVAVLLFITTVGKACVWIPNHRRTSPDPGGAGSQEVGFEQSTCCHSYGPRWAPGTSLEGSKHVANAPDKHARGSAQFVCPCFWVLPYGAAAQGWGGVGGVGG